MRLLLQHKIFIGYFLLMAVIGCMVAIVLHERKRVSEIEQESITIFQTQSNISTTHRHITVLATFGESVMTWTGKDCELYRTRRLKADSLLQILREQCKEFVRPEQVDSLRSQLLNKEEHLLRMKEIFRQQKQIDSLLAGQYSLVTSQANTCLSAINVGNQQITKQTPNFTPNNVKLGVFVLFKKTAERLCIDQ
jgi:two-component system aerobic respiration control sensor histidine kinase ArcB